MRFTRFLRGAGSVMASAVLVGGLIAQGAGVASADDGGGHGHGEDGTAIFVSKTGNPSKSGKSCDTAKYSKIQKAVDAAPNGATVVVCRGTYFEQVVIGKPLTLKGRDATIDENGVTPTFSVPMPPGPALVIFAGVIIGSSHVSFSGFTVKDALGEGILAAGVNGPIEGVSIDHNSVVNNDQGGGNPPASTYFQCQVNGQIPGDCGEGVHFITVANSRISDNYVSGNSGGILLTDELGPTHGNVIEGNTVTKNAFDCGITVPGHNGNAVDATGKRQPSMAGVYDNVIRENWITDNGLLGEGAGVLFANAGPGTGSYDNLVEDNYIAGNELAGVTMHAHTVPPGMTEDLNGNRIIENTIGTNNVGPGDPLDTLTVTGKTGILVYAANVPVHVTIEDNRISDNHFGIWLGVHNLVTASLEDNSFHNVAVHVFNAP